jgi:hypothetical protein
LGVGRWVCGRVAPGALGVEILGVGCSRAATTRSPDGILCRAPSDVVMKHPSSRRRDRWWFIFRIFWALGVWALGGTDQVLGVGCSGATTTRFPDGILCRAPLDVVLKHP